MIPADHRRWAHFIFRPYLHHIMKKSFYSVRLINAMPQLNADKSLCICPNHISWWDGFFFYYLGEKIIPGKLHCMMLESQLRQYHFFSRLGAYSIDPADAFSIKETTAYTISLFKDPQNTCVIFPQGKICPQSNVSRAVKKGLIHFTENTGTQILPVALRIEWYNRRKPTLLVRFGSVIDAAMIADGMDSFTEEFNRNISLLESAAEHETFENEYLL